MPDGEKITTVPGRREQDFGQYYNNKYYTLFCYDAVPAGVVPAETTSLVQGNRVLYEVEIGPDKGKFYDCIVTANNYGVLMNKLKRKVQIFVGKR